MNTKTKITIIISAIMIALIGIFYAFQKYSTPEAVWSRYKAEQEAKIAQNEREIASLRAERIELQRLDDTLSGSINQLKEENAKIKNCLDHGVLQCEKVEKGLSLIPRVSAGEGIGTSNGGAIVVNGTANSTPESAEPGYNQIQCTIGSGSHDVRHLAKNYPGVAGWKNNSVSGLTLGSKALEAEFNKAGIQWFVGTKRPANEGNWYYGFPDLENGLKAKLLVIKRSYKNATISKYLSQWGTDYVPHSLNPNRTIGSLSDSELLSLIRLQIIKESGKAMADYVFNNVLICDKNIK